MRGFWRDNTDEARPHCHRDRLDYFRYSAAMLDARRKRLVYRANYRGFKEADLILGGFAKAHIESMSDEEVTLFEKLLEAKDHDIYAWISGNMPVPAHYDTPLLSRLKQFDPSK